MKIQALQENVQKGIARCSRLVNSKPQIPILSFVLLETKEGVLRATATNTETTIQTSIPAKVVEEGSVCVQAKLFYELISTLPKATVTIETEGEVVVVSAGRIKAKIPSLSSSEFPEQKEPQKNKEVVFSKEAFLNTVTQVVFATASDETRPILSGLRMEKRETGTAFIATDGYRLSLHVLPETIVVKEPINIPSRSLAEVIKLCSEEKQEKNMEMNETVDGQVVFSLGDTTVYTRKIEGEYPNYQRIIPTKRNTQMKVDTQELGAAVKSAALFARENAGIIKLSLSEEGMSVSANTPSVGENVVLVDGEFEGEGIEVAINSRFLLDFLQNSSTKELLIETTGSLNPTVFKNPQEENYLHIIMPVRVQG